MLFFTVFIDLSDKIRNFLLFFQEKKILLREHEDGNLTQLEGGVQGEGRQHSRRAVSSAGFSVLDFGTSTDARV